MVGKKGQDLGDQTSGQLQFGDEHELEYSIIDFLEFGILRAS